jgi:hypothetical protein
LVYEKAERVGRVGEPPWQLPFRCQFAQL